jgi:hypothetical protein
MEVKSRSNLAAGLATAKKPAHLAWLATCPEGRNRLLVAMVRLEDRVEPGAVKQFSHSLIGANQFDLTVLLSG